MRDFSLYVVAKRLAIGPAAAHACWTLQLARFSPLFLSRRHPFFAVRPVRTIGGRATSARAIENRIQTKQREIIMLRSNLAVRLAATAGLAFAVCGAFADVPRTFNYQGKLPGYTNQTVGITVRLYDAPTGGNNLFTELNSTTLRDGVFSITVGSVSGVPTSALGPLPIWVGVSVDGGPELTPRSRLHSVPFAYKALGAEQLIIPGTFDSAAIVSPAGEVLIDQRVQIGAAAD